MKISPTVSFFSLAEVTVRLVTSNEVARWQTLMARHHYLGFPGFVGEHLYQVAEWQGQWLDRRGLPVPGPRGLDWLDARTTAASVALCRQ